MKKALIYSLSLALILSLTACGHQEPQQENTPPDPAVTSTQPDISTPESREDPEPESQAVPALEPVVDTPPAEQEEPGEQGEQAPGKAEEPVQVEEPFNSVNETVYVTGTVNLRSSYSTQSDKVDSMTKGQSATRVGVGTGEADGWSKIQLSDGSIVYVSSKYLSTTKPASGGGGGGDGGTTSKPSTPSKPSVDTSKPSQPGTPSSGDSSDNQSANDRRDKLLEEAMKDFKGSGTMDPNAPTDKDGNPMDGRV